MEATAHSQPLRLAARALLLAIAVAAIAVAAYGLWLIPGALGLGAGAPDAATVAPSPQPVLAIGKPARTTFGHLRVLDAHAVTGLTNQQLGNMTHGISGLIDARNAQMQIAIELSNSTNLATHWTAADFRLETVSGEHMYAALGGTQESGTLRAGLQRRPRPQFRGAARRLQARTARPRRRAVRACPRRPRGESPARHQGNPAQPLVQKEGLTP